MGTSNSKSDPSGPISEYNPNLEAIQVTDDPNYGRIKLVRETKTHHQMILKEFMFDTKQACEEELRFFKERASFGHPNMVHIIGYNSSQNKNLCSNLFKVSVFIEILPKELDTVLKERARKKADYSENEILLLAGNVISALYHLQTKNMAHGDIRPLNIFVQGNTYKVTDPKLETDKNANALSKAIINRSHTLLSPELLANVPHQKFEFTEDPFKADVFSLGATLLHAATLKSSEELYDYQNGRLDQRRLAERLEEVRVKYSPFTYQLISSMLRLTGKERPDFADLRNILLPYQEVIQHQGDLPSLSSHQETFGGSAAVRRQGGERVKSSANTNQTRRVQFSEGQMSSENDNLDDMVREALRKSEDVIRQAQAETGVSRQANFGGEIRNNEIPKKSQNIGRNVNAPQHMGFEQNDTEIDALDAKIKNAIQNSQNSFKQTQGVDLGGQVKSFNQQSNAVNFTQKNIEGDRRNQEIAKKSQNVARNVNAPPQIGFQQDLNVNRKVEVRETKEDALREPVQLFQEYRREREEERPINQIQEERLRKSQQMQNIQPAGVNYQLPNVTPGPGLGGYATQNQQDIQRQVYSQTFGQPTNFGYESGFRQNVPQQTSTTTYEATQSYQPINIEGLLSNYNAPSTNISQHHVRNVTGEHAVRSSPRVTASDDVRIGQIAGNSTISTNPFNYTSTTSTTGEAFQTTYGQHDFGVQQYRTGGPLPVNPETERILKLYHDVDTTQRISTPLHQGGGFRDVYTTTYGQNDFGAQQYQIGGIGSTQEHHFISNTGHIDTGVGVAVPVHSQTEKVLKAYRQVDTSPRAQGVTVSSFQQTGALGDNFKTTYGQHDFGTQQYQSGIGMSLPVNPETEKILKAYSHTLERRQVPDIQTGEFGRTDAVIYYENQIQSGPGGFAEVQFEHRQ